MTDWRDRLPPPPPRIPRYGIDAPIEMRPKLYDKLIKPTAELAIDTYFTNPALLDECRKQEAEAKSFVDRLLLVMAQHEDDAFFKLVEAGVAIERLQRWNEQAYLSG